MAAFGVRAFPTILHDELVAAGGRYAGLFALQARAYQAAGSAG